MLFARKLKPIQLIEWLLGLAVVFTLIYDALFLRTNGFLPPPFYFNYDDTFMDGYNTAYWSTQLDIYDTWLSVYPPVSFAWFKLFSLSQCYVGTPAYSRACDMLPRAMLISFTFINFALVLICYRRESTATAWPRALAVSFGMPMMFALERGNLIVPAFTFFVLGFGPLLRRARSRWLCVGMAVNFKPYLVATVFAVLLKRRWRWFEGAAVACILVYVVTWIMIGEGTPTQIIHNTLTFAQSNRTADWSVAYYPSSYIPLHDFLENSHSPLARMIGSWPLDLADWFLPLISRASQAIGLIAAVAIWLKPGLYPQTRGLTIAVIVALTAQETGGYAVCFVTFLLFFEEARGLCRTSAILLCYLISICSDVSLVQLDVQLGLESYLGGRPIVGSYGLTLGTILRPALLLVIMNLLSIATLRSFSQALVREGRLTVPWRHNPTIVAAL